MSLEKVKEYFAPLGRTEDIMEFSASSATVELAAKALNVAPARIAKTLSFKVNDGCVLVVTAGDAKIDNAKYKAIKKKKITPTAALPFGSRSIYLFSPEDAAAIRRELNIPVHDDTTIYRDFFDFLEERDYTLSYKMPFMISLIDNLSSIGEAEIDKVLDGYIAFYMDRLDKGLAADRAACPYTYEYLSDRKAVKKNMLTNPFEKFERKRFMYYSKDLGKIALNTALFNSLKSEDFKRIRNQMETDLKEYYSGIENKGTD